MRFSHIWHATTSNLFSAFLAFISLGLLARSLSSRDFGLYVLVVSFSTLVADLIDFGAGLHIIIESRKLSSFTNRIILRRNLEVKISLILFLLPLALIASIILRNYFLSVGFFLSILFYLRNNCLTTFRSIDKIQSYGSVILLERILFLVFLFPTPNNLNAFLLLQSFTLGVSICYAKKIGITVICKPTSPFAILPNLRKSLQLGLGSALSNVNLIFPIIIGTLFGYAILAEYSLLMKTLLPVQIIGSSLAMLRVKYESPAHLKFANNSVDRFIASLFVVFLALGFVYIIPVTLSFFTVSRYNYSHQQVAMVVFIVFCQQILTYKTAGLQALRRFKFINFMLLFFIASYAICLLLFSSIPKLDTVLLIELCLTATLTIAYTSYSKR